MYADAGRDFEWSKLSTGPPPHDQSNGLQQHMPASSARLPLLDSNGDSNRAVAASEKDLDKTFRFEKWENMDLITKNRMTAFLRTPPLKRSQQDCDIFSSLLRGEEFEQIRSSPRGILMFSVMICYPLVNACQA
jgi:hypothetical protein